MKKYPTIYLEQQVHRNSSKLLIKFKFDNGLISIIRSISGATWSKTLAAWYLENTKENYDKVITTFKGITIINSSKISKTIPFKRKLTNESKNDFK